MTGGMERRVRRLEVKGAHSGGRAAPHWTPEDTTLKVLDEMDFAVATNSPMEICEEELEAVGVRDLSELPDAVRPHIVLQPSTCGAIRKRYEGLPAAFESWRDKVARYQEQVEARVKESKQRDRGLLKDNRAACRLPPLTSEQLAEYGLEGTVREGEV